MMSFELSRRSFIKSGAVLSGSVFLGAGLSGCASWTPRSTALGDKQTSGQGEENSTMVDEQTKSNIDDNLLLISGGTYTMGSRDDEGWRGADEMQHAVTLQDFYLAPFETTQQEYQQIMGTNPSSLQGGDLPVESVTWLEAIAFCNALSKREGLSPAYQINGEDVAWDLSAEGYRLPSEAEWEFACRAGTTTPFNTQTSISSDTEANYYGTYPYGIEENYFSQDDLETQPGVYRQQPIAVGSFAPNAWELYDMHGNVAEWVWDYYGNYSADAETDPTGPTSGTLRVNRGGGWNDFGKSLRSAYRAALPATRSSPSVGFRIARNAVGGTGVIGAESAVLSAAASGADTLIAYFSWSGNTRGVAEEIARQTGFDLVEIECYQLYSSDYNTVLEQAQYDQNVQARPTLSTQIADMSRYGRVIIGYPNWWASIPMPIASFLESYDFTGKSILPFCSHGGGRFGQSLTAVSKLAPQALLGEGLSIHYSGEPSLAADVASWLERNGVA